MLLKVLGVRRKAKTFISASNLNELKGKGKTRYTLLLVPWTKTISAASNVVF